MTTRRDFLKTCAMGAAAGLAPSLSGCSSVDDAPGRRPITVSTWYSGLKANEAAWPLLTAGGDPMDAVLAGVRTAEEDTTNQFVGLGGLPDRDGRVTVDASVMDGKGRAGSVACLEDVVHASGVARAVMDHTPHVMLVGDGARQFAVEQGFPLQPLLTDASREDWRRWLAEDGTYAPQPNSENHDTISQLALTEGGRLAGVCTTSGMRWKMPGRVGDSPIIGAALFVDDSVGACCATGNGEAVMTTCGSFLVVELMRQGRSPDEACRLAIERIVAARSDWKDLQVGYIALDRQGRVGSFSLVPGFQYAVHDGRNNLLVDAESRL